MAKKKEPKIQNPTGTKPFNYGVNKSVYGLHNPIRQGYAVDTPGGDPAKKGANGRLINVYGDAVDFYIEEIECDFEMGGTTAQSQRLRQFFPHNFVQPTLTIRGRAPNSFQFNRLAGFVRLSHHTALRGREIRSLADGEALRTITNPTTGDQSIRPTMRLIVLNGAFKGFPYNGTPKEGTGAYNVKGKHQSWKLEGYIKQMAAGAQRFDHAPAFEFPFTVSESDHAGNTGIWADDAVFGSELATWTQVFKHRGKGSFIRDPEDVKNGGVRGEETYESINSILGPVEQEDLDFEQ